MATNIIITTHKVSGVDSFLVGTGLRLVSVFALLAPLAAHADVGDTKTLDEVSVTASRVSTAIKESPVTITVIDEEELDTIKFVDSEKELLQRIPGTSMIRNLRIPMGSKNYTANLIDGMAVGKFGSGVQSFANDTNGSDIQRIEILRGPSSVLYGSNAIGGVINVITRDAPLEPEYRVWGEGGTYHRKRGGVSSAGTFEGYGYFLDANFLDYTGSQDRTENKRKTVSGKLIKDLTDNSMLTLRAEYLDVLKENPGTLSQAEYDADWNQAGVDDAHTDKQMASVSAFYMLAPSDNSEFNLNYSIRHHNEAGAPSYSATGDFGDDEVLNQNMTATYRHDFDYLRSRIIAGVDGQHSRSKDVSYDGRNAKAAINSNWDIAATIISPFLQFEISPLDKLRLTFGARYDNVKYDANDKFNTNEIEADFSSITRKVGATWQLDANNNLWAGFGEGFVVPSRTYLFTTTRYTPNPNLSPEMAENWEAGIRGRLFNKRLKYDLALYHTTIKDLVVVGDDGSTVINIGEARFKGVEVSAAFMATDYLKFAGAYTFSRNKYIDYKNDGDDYSGNDLTSSPKHHLNLRATLTPIENLDIELEWDKISNYYTYIDNDADPEGKASRPGIFNLRFSYKRGSLSYWVHARNLLDEKHADRVSYSTRGGGSRSYTAGEPLSVYAGIAYKW